MSTPNEPSDVSKPIVKDKNPHNYRKVGYSMIVISVSLVLIGLLVWAIGDDYHFSSDIMGNQEIDSMTPKHGFNLVFYDTQQPVGAKLKLLDSASAIDDAQQKQIQYAQQNPSPLGKVLIFNETLAANKQLVHYTVAAITQYQADLAKAQAAKAQAAASAPANQTTSVSPIKPNATTVMAQNKTESVLPLGQSGEKLGITVNATAGTSNMHTNATITTIPKSNVTSVTTAHNQLNMTGNVTATLSKSNTTSASTTQNPPKSITVSQSVGLTAK